MKLSELSIVKEETKGKWKIGNLRGIYKNFKKNDSMDALAWMRNRAHDDEEARKLVFLDGHWREDPKVAARDDRKLERDEKKAERDREANNPYAPRKTTSAELEDLYNRAVDAAASSFPDGDPIDHLLPFLNKRNWDSSHIDLAFKKFGRGREKKGWDTFLADMWDDFANDQMADARAGLEKTDVITTMYDGDNEKLKAKLDARKPKPAPDRSDSPFYDVKDGKVVATRNPWK